jgi:hypothetical protein
MNFPRSTQVSITIAVAALPMDYAGNMEARELIITSVAWHLRAGNPAKATTEAAPGGYLVPPNNSSAASWKNLKIDAMNRRQKPLGLQVHDQIFFDRQPTHWPSRSPC